MSTNLYWQPAPKARKARTFDQLKFALAPTLFDHDGSLNSEPVTVDLSLVPFLRGIIAGTMNATLKEEAEQLIAAIERHGEIELWTE